MRVSVSEWRVWCSRLLAPVTWAVADAAARARVVALTLVSRAWLAVAPRAAISAVSGAPEIAELTADEQSAPPVWRAALRLTHERAVALLAVALSVGAYCWYAAHGDTLVYLDSVSHMMIARRIFFSRTPGLGQIGTTWPPFTHLLMLPFVWIEPLYRSGLAGALPSMLFYVLGTLYTFRAARLLFGSPAAGWVAALVFALNPNTLYMQSTPMTELALLGCVMVGLFHLFRWVETERPFDLVICAAAFAAGTLVRYDAWALATAEALVIGYIAWRRHGRKSAEGTLWLYVLLAYAGCVGWILFNWVLFGDPLYFLDGPYSAKFQQDALKSQGALPTYHNLLNSAHEYFQATVDVTAWPLVALAVVGCVVLFIRIGLAQRMLPVYAVWSLMFFNVLSMFLGITTVFAPEVHLPHVGAITTCGLA